MGIKLSPKHGINTSCTVCFFCGKETGLAFLGKLKGDVKAPRRIIANYTPCDECKEKHKDYCVIIEVVREDNGLPPIQEGVWPTGRWCMMSKAGAEKLFKDKHDYMLLESTLYERLVKNNEKHNS